MTVTGIFCGCTAACVGLGELEGYEPCHLEAGHDGPHQHRGTGAMPVVRIEPVGRAAREVARAEYDAFLDSLDEDLAPQLDGALLGKAIGSEASEPSRYPVGPVVDLDKVVSINELRDGERERARRLVANPPPAPAEVHPFPSDAELLLARLIRGEAPLRDAKGVTAKRFATPALKWLWCLIETVLEAGASAPSDDVILLRTWSGITGSDGCLASRGFLAEVTEEELRAELARLRALEVR